MKLSLPTQIWAPFDLLKKKEKPFSHLISATQSNPINTDTKGAIKSVSVERVKLPYYRKLTIHVDIAKKIYFAQNKRKFSKS